MTRAFGKLMFLGLLGVGIVAGTAGVASANCMGDPSCSAPTKPTTTTTPPPPPPPPTTVPPPPPTTVPPTPTPEPTPVPPAPAPTPGPTPIEPAAIPVAEEIVEVPAPVETESAPVPEPVETEDECVTIVEEGGFPWWALIGGMLVGVGGTLAAGALRKRGNDDEGENVEDENIDNNETVTA